MKKQSLVVGCTRFVLAVFAAVFVGCSSNSGWNPCDPSSVVKSPSSDMLLPIYSQASPADESQEMPAGATFPTDDDLKFTARDYVVGPLDIVDVSVLDLYQEGLETVLRRQVTESGKIDLPMLPSPIKAEGLTQEQLRETIIQAYSPDVLKNPTVSVTVIVQRQNTFSILGAVARPGAYNMVKRDMRLMDAIAAAGGQAQTNIPWIYVFRQGPSQPSEPATQPAEENGELPPLPEVPGAEKPKPRTPGSSPADHGKSGADDLKNALPSATVSPSAGSRLSEMAWTPIPASKPAGQTDVGNLDTHKSTKWVQSGGGKSTQVSQTAGVASKPSGEGASRVSPSGLPVAAGKPEEDLFGWKKMGGEGRIIAIDVSKLNAGDPKMNVIIQDNDVITIPLLEQGEFYVMGNVQRPGVYSLTGRKVTIKMAVAASGNLDPLAMPKNCILVRRLNDQQEQMIPIDIEDIFLGKKPDIYLKANDVIAVGTNAAAPFLAVLRNAFRLTYGFGFIYDRNFGEGTSQTGELTPDRFTRW